MKRLVLLALALAAYALVRELRRPYDEARVFPAPSSAPPAQPRRRGAHRDWLDDASWPAGTIVGFAEADAA